MDCRERKWIGSHTQERVNLFCVRGKRDGKNFGHKESSSQKKKKREVEQDCLVRYERRRRKFLSRDEKKGFKNPSPEGKGGGSGRIVNSGENKEMKKEMSHPLEERGGRRRHPAYW